MVLPAAIFLIAVARSKGLLWVPLLEDLPLVDTNKSPLVVVELEEPELEEPEPELEEPELEEPELEEPPTASKIHCWQVLS